MELGKKKRKFLDNSFGADYERVLRLEREVREMGEKYFLEKLEICNLFYLFRILENILICV